MYKRQDGEGADLLDVGGVVERAGGNGFGEEERLLFELEGGDQHGRWSDYIRAGMEIWGSGYRGGCLRDAARRGGGGQARIGVGCGAA